MAAVIPELIATWFTVTKVLNRPHLLDRARKTLTSDDPQTHAAMWGIIADFDLHADLGRITCPTMVVVGDRDTVTPIAVAQRLRDGIAGASLRVVPAAAHLPQLEQSTTVNRGPVGLADKSAFVDELDLILLVAAVIAMVSGVIALATIRQRDFVQSAAPAGAAD